MSNEKWGDYTQKIFILFRKEEAQNGNDKGREYA